MRYYYLKDGQLKERKKRVIFLFKGRMRGTGSRYMRCDQLASFGKRYFGEEYDFSVDVLPNPRQKPRKWRDLMKNAESAVLIILKGSLDILEPEEQ
jgi:hypothetical protein